MKDEYLESSKWIQRITNWLYDNDKYFVFNPWGQRIGHQMLEILTAACVAKRDNKILLLIPGFAPVNKEIFKCHFNCDTYYFKKDLRARLINNLIISMWSFDWIYNRVRAKLAKLFPVAKRIFPKISCKPRVGIEKGKYNRHRLIGTKYYYDYDLLMSQKINITLSQRQEKKAKEVCNKMGLPEDGWFVCIHAREPGYLGDYSTYDYRDANISNYIPAIKYIVKKGGYVVRTGDPSMTPLPKLDKVIDYATSRYRSGLMDLFLTSKCHFFLGCASGPTNLALLFGRPICAVNYGGVDIRLSIKEYDVIVPKHVFSVMKNCLLCFNERIKSDIYIEDIPSETYFFIENTPSEILHTVKDYLRLLETDDFTSWNLSLQNEIRSTIRQKYEYFASQESLDDARRAIFPGRLNSKGMIGKYYLEKCWGYSPYLENLNSKYHMAQN